VSKVTDDSCAPLIVEDNCAVGEETCCYYNFDKYYRITHDSDYAMTFTEYQDEICADKVDDIDPKTLVVTERDSCVEDADDTENTLGYYQIVEAETVYYPWWGVIFETYSNSDCST